MLPPDHGLASAGTRAGPACSCTLKPLPCLVDNWIPGPRVPYEQPLSIQTDMEYTLDTRMFPGWDPVTGQTQPALVVDTAVLTARSQAAAAPPPAQPILVSSPCRPRASAAATPTRNSVGRFRQSSAAARGAWASRTPATPAELPPAPAYHPAFRPADPLYPQRPTQMFRHHRPVQQQQQQLQHQQQPLQGATTQHQTTTDTDLLALIASIDVEPAGYTLDVDWLLGTQPQASAATYSATQRVGAAPPCHLPAAGHPHRQAAPCLHPGAPQQQVTFTPTVLTDYQSQFYPGATCGGGNGCIVGTSGSTAISGCGSAAAHGFLSMSGLAMPVIGRSRSTKRRLLEDSPCEGAVPAVIVDVSASKRARWAGGWTGPYGHGLGVAHVPSPLQNRAY